MATPVLEADSRPAPISMPGRASVAWLALLLTWLAYVAAGALGLALAIPPGYASPLYPAAGVALASVLVYGRHMAVAVALAAVCVNAFHGTQGPWGVAALVLPLANGVGAGLQALVGAALVRRFVAQPLALSTPGDIGRFFACCAVGSIVSASVASIGFLLSDTVVASGLAITWATWWAGDLAGILIGTPIALTLIGQPRADWTARRVPVGLTLSLVTLCLGLGIVQVGRWNADRVEDRFVHDASRASLVLVTQLQEPLRALEALYGVANVSQQMSRRDVRVATENWLGGGSVRAMGWAERVRRDDVAAYESRVRAEGAPDFRIVEPRGSASVRAFGPPGPASASSAADPIVLRRLEPASTLGAAIGTDVGSVAGAREAIGAAIESGRPASTRGYTLSDTNGGDAPIGVTVYQAVYDAPDGPAADRAAGLRGVVFVALSLSEQLRVVAAKVPGYLDLCVVDALHLASRQRLAGAVGCEKITGGFVDERPLNFAGRQWSVRITALPSAVPDADDLGSWAFSVAGLLSSAMLGASLLITTGRTRRIESAVRERTTALRAEVADRQVAEAALRTSEERFRSILDNLPIGVVYTDPAGRVIQANPRYRELTGYSEAELRELAPSALSPAEDAAHDEALTAQLAAGEIPMYRRHKRVLTKTGRVIWVRATVTLLRDAFQAPWRIVGVFEDITEHLRLEEAERAREAAEVSNRAKSDFLSRMSHELRTPLNAMLGFAQLLEIDQRHPLAPTQRPWVGQIQQAGWHLLEMINDVLDLSRIESGNLRLHTTTVDLGGAIGATVALVASDAVRKGVRISDDLAAGTSSVLGDATRIKQILTNLLSNAVKYNADGGRVHIATRRVDDTVEVAVTDTGMGMTAEQMEGLFRPFNRLGRERSALEGTGIGLVISQRLAELMGGSIGVKSLPGEGSSFTLRLPMAQDPTTVPSALDAFDAMPTDYHRRVVHYVEDNETNVEVMRGILAQRPQVQLEVSTNGLDGLAAIRAQRPHLLLLDMHLPDISGMELLRHLKTDPATATIPVVVVSADALALQIDTAMAAGADRYLTKPVDVGELLTVLDELLDRMDTGFS